MERINEQYICLGKFEIFKELLQASNEKNYKKERYFQKLISVITEYEKLKKTCLEKIYIRIEDLSEEKFFNVEEIPIGRQSILNATLFAIYNGDIYAANQLSLFFEYKEVLSHELGDTLLNYVLEHSMDMNEYMCGEKERLVYYKKLSILTKKNIYGNEQSKGRTLVRKGKEK